MKQYLLMSLSVLVVSGLLYLPFVMYNNNYGRVVVYDCGIAEISPDSPIDARQKCRELRSRAPLTEKGNK